MAYSLIKQLQNRSWCYVIIGVSWLCFLRFMFIVLLSETPLLIMMDQLPANPTAIANTNAFSSANCAGDGLNRNGRWQFRSCQYTNICYNVVGAGKVSYHVSPTEYLTQESIGVSLSPLGKTGTPVHFQPEFTNTTVPAGVRRVQGTSIFFVEYNGDNFGHVLMDEVYPWFRLLELFGRDGKRTEFRAIRVATNPPFLYSCDWMIEKGWLSNDDKCASNYRKIMKSITRHSLVELHKEYGNQSVCFDEVLAGIGMLSDHGLDETNHGARLTEVERTRQGNVDLANIGSNTVWRFRNWVLMRMGLDAAKMVPSSSTLDVVLNNKKSGRGAINFDNVAEMMKTRLPPGVTISSSFDFHRASFEEQVKITSTAKVMASTVGGSSLIATFLPRGSTLLLYWTPDRGHLDASVYNNMPQIKVRWLQPNNTEPLPEEFSTAVFNGLKQYDEFAAREAMFEAQQAQLPERN